MSKHEMDSLHEKEMGVYSTSTFCKQSMHKKGTYGYNHLETAVRVHAIKNKMAAILKQI